MRRYSMVKRRKGWESRAERGRTVEGVGSDGVTTTASLMRTAELPTQASAGLGGGGVEEVGRINERGMLMGGVERNRRRLL